MEHLDFTTSILFPYINFFIFVGLAVFFLKKPISKIVLERRQKFQKMLDEAAKAKLEAEEKLAAINLRLKGLDDEVNKIKQQSFDQAKREYDKIVGDANRLADHLKNEAKSIVEAELLNAKKALQAEVIKQVKTNVEAKIKSEFTAEKQVEFIQTRAKNLSELTRG